MSKLVGQAFSLPVLVSWALLLSSCGNPLKPRIDAENRLVAQAKNQFNQIRTEVESDLQKDRLFSKLPTSAQRGATASRPIRRN